VIRECTAKHTAIASILHMYFHPSFDCLPFDSTRQRVARALSVASPFESCRNTVKFVKSRMARGNATEQALCLYTSTLREVQSPS